MELEATRLCVFLEALSDARCDLSPDLYVEGEEMKTFSVFNSFQTFDPIQ